MVYFIKLMRHYNQWSRSLYYSEDCHRSFESLRGGLSLLMPGSFPVSPLKQQNETGIRRRLKQIQWLFSDYHVICKNVKDRSTNVHLILVAIVLCIAKQSYLLSVLYCINRGSVPSPSPLRKFIWAVFCLCATLQRITLNSSRTAVGTEVKRCKSSCIWIISVFDHWI